LCSSELSIAHTLPDREKRRRVSISVFERSMPARDSVIVAESEFDDAVQDFLRAYAVPRRLREARLADRLGAAEATVVPTRWGDLMAWRLGSGPGVLLVHGWEDDNSLWSPLIDELDRRGRAVVAFDLPGHGASGGDWGVSFEGSDGIVAVSAALGPIDAVVAHSAGCGVATGAIGEGWKVERAAFIAPPLAEGNRWLRYAGKLGVSDDVAMAAKEIYDAAHGPERAMWNARTAYAALDVDLLVVQSRDDERHSFRDTQEVVALNRRARLVLIDGPTHRRTARDPGVINLVADFVSRAAPDEFR
jgi:pimeloyl-ACP methyl ester carboxylesterase